MHCRQYLMHCRQFQQTSTSYRILVYQCFSIETLMLLKYGMHNRNNQKSRVQHILPLNAILLQTPREIVCSYHVTYAFQSESTRYSCLNVKKLLARNRCEIWRLSDCNLTRTHNHLVGKRTLNHLAKMAKWLSVRLQTKWLWVRVKLQSRKRDVKMKLPTWSK